MRRHSISLLFYHNAQVCTTIFSHALLDFIQFGNHSRHVVTQVRHRYKGISLQDKEAVNLEIICRFPQEGPSLEEVLMGLLRQQPEEETPWQNHG